MRTVRTPALAFLVLASLAVAGCQQPAPPAALSEADQAAIRQVVEAALAIGNTQPMDSAKYVESYYAPDAVLLQPNGPTLQGREQIVSFFKAFPPITDLRFELLEMGGTADTAWVRGTYSMRMTLPGASEPVKETGKYLEIWKKQPDGSWRAARDIFNSDSPLPAPAAAQPGTSG